MACIYSVQSTSQVTSSSSPFSMTMVNNQKKFLRFVNKAINEFLKLNANDATIDLIEEFVPYYTYSIFLKDQTSGEQPAQQQTSNQYPSSVQNIVESTQVLNERQPSFESQSQISIENGQPQPLPVSMKRKHDEKNNSAEIQVRRQQHLLNQIDNIAMNQSIQNSPLVQTMTPDTIQSAPFPCGVSKSSEKFQQQQSIEYPKQTSTSTPVQMVTQQQSLVEMEPQGQLIEQDSLNAQTQSEDDEASDSNANTPSVNNGAQFQCPECMFHAPHVTRLRKHRRFHERKLQFKCELCSYSTERLCMTVRHQNKYH